MGRLEAMPRADGSGRCSSNHTESVAGSLERSPAPSSFQAQKTTFWISPSCTPRLYMATSHDTSAWFALKNRGVIPPDKFMQLLEDC